MILLIDNYDSFTYNLVQAFGALKVECEVHRNDQITPEEIERRTPDYLVISPGPCTPREAGISNDVITRFSGKIPILGVCLGHQCMGHTYGASIIRAPEVMHGKTSQIHHDNKTLYANLSNPFEATRYHSLVIQKDTLPDCFQISAWTDSGDIMGIRHKELPLEGVQFHPESFLTQEGDTLLANFLEHYSGA